MIHPLLNNFIPVAIIDSLSGCDVISLDVRKGDFPFFPVNQSNSLVTTNLLLTAHDVILV